MQEEMKKISEDWKITDDEKNKIKEIESRLKKLKNNNEENDILNKTQKLLEKLKNQYENNNIQEEVAWEYFIVDEKTWKKIITDEQWNPLNEENKTRKINYEEVIENIEDDWITKEEVEDFYQDIEYNKNPTSMMTKLLEILEKFLWFFDWKKFSTYLDKYEGLVVEWLNWEAKEKFYNKNTKYNEIFKTILEKSWYKKWMIVLADEKKIKAWYIPFALELDTQWKNLFLQAVNWEDYSKDNAKIIVSYKDKYWNFQTEEVLIKNLEKTIKEYDKNHDFFDHINSSHSVAWELNIDKYNWIKNSLTETEKLDYLLWVKSWLITDVINENWVNKFKILWENNYTSKEKMLSLVQESKNNPKLFWEWYLNVLGIQLHRNERKDESENIKIVIDLPWDNDFIYIDNWKSKTIFEYKNWKIIEGNILWIDWMQVAWLFPSQIIIFAHASKNNVSLKSMKEFHYSEIKKIFSWNKNLSNLKILNPNNLSDKKQAVLSLDKL
jgi:hypothetical protein